MIVNVSLPIYIFCLICCWFESINYSGIQYLITEWDNYQITNITFKHVQCQGKNVIRNSFSKCDQIKRMIDGEVEKIRSELKSQ